MMRGLHILVMLVLTSLVIDAQEPVGTPDQPGKERKLGLAKPIVMEADREVYGAELAGKKYVALDVLHQEPKSWDGKVVQLRGRITSVCPKKGCWMMVKEKGKEIRVTFTGYKFFVPLDSANREVAVEGTLSWKVMTEAERRHYAEDAGKSPEEIAKIVGDVDTITLTADAVQMGKLPPLPPAKTEKQGEGAGSCCGTEGGSCGGECEEEKTKGSEKKGSEKKGQGG